MRCFRILKCTTACPVTPALVWLTCGMNIRRIGILTRFRNLQSFGSFPCYNQSAQTLKWVRQFSENHEPLGEDFSKSELVSVWQIKQDNGSEYQPRSMKWSRVVGFDIELREVWLGPITEYDYWVIFRLIFSPIIFHEFKQLSPVWVVGRDFLGYL